MYIYLCVHYVYMFAYIYMILYKHIHIYIYTCVQAAEAVACLTVRVLTACLQIPLPYQAIL